MRKAAPVAPTTSKEEWLANRIAQTPKPVAAIKKHGARGGDTQPQTTQSLADVPTTVPELPNAYLVRDEDLSQLKAALLANGGAVSTALTAKKQQNKVGAHGMVRGSITVVNFFKMCCFRLTH